MESLTATILHPSSASSLAAILPAVELSKFRLKEGKAKRVDEWMELLNSHINEVLLTLKDEKMHVEAVFRGRNEEGEFLYWLSVQGEGGISVE
ncbi:hypothetical protein PcaKH15_07630 [Parageobacillus caldoxylosilyticus]|nr:hypothetical protein PcaKH15_07630 [Parageobacillus caldoxylosilyticus]BDG38631.1 hypothetical protein PcaKH16_07700 [Parageobacillus caldoxylosilyticus]